MKVKLLPMLLVFIVVISIVVIQAKAHVVCSNTPPTNSNVTINNSNGTLTAFVSGVNDADGDVVSVNYDWWMGDNTAMKSIAVLYLPMTGPYDNGTRNLTFDFSSYNNVGVLAVGSAFPTFNSSGLYGGAFSFDGVNDFISVPDSSSLRFNNFSITAWINTRTIGLQGIVTRWVCDVNSQTEFQFILNGTNYPVFGILNNSINSRNTLSNISLATNKWYFLVVTYSDSQKNVSIYVNSTLVGRNNFSDARNMVDGNMSVFVGARNCTGQDLFFDGSIDEVKLYNRSLTAEQIFAIYNNSAPRYDRIVENETNSGEVWRVKATPIDSHGLNGTGVFSNNVTIV